MEKDIEIIKREIRDIKPNFTDGLLDLLYEYVMRKYTDNFKEKVGMNFDVSSFVEYVANPLDFAKGKK